MVAFSAVGTDIGIPEGVDHEAALASVLASLGTLPGTRTEDDVPPEALARLKPRQHPDHPTE